MKTALAFAVLAAVAPCLLAIERTTAAPPAAPPAVPCKECCEGSCCKEKSKAVAAKAATPCASGQCASGQCASGDCDCSGKKQAAVDSYFTLPLPPAAPSTISIAALPQTCPSADCGHSACSGAAACSGTAAATASGTTCTEQKTLIYSAMPLGVPSPFAKDGEYANPNRIVIAGQPYSFNIPLPQPPAPIAPPSHDVIMEHRLAYAPVTPVSHAAPQAAESAQVLYNIQILEDNEGCLTEYESFRDGDCIMFADSDTLLPALRILQKHELVQGLSSPKLICTTGRRAQFEVGRQIAGEENTAWEGVKLEVEAEQHENGLKVDLAVHTSHDERTCDVRTAVVVECGKSVILKSQGTAGDGEADGAQPAIYVVVTPEVIK